MDDPVDRVAAARRDPGRAVLEGLHALKHALRFGASIEAAWTDDAARLRRLATELAPDEADRLLALAEPVGQAVFARLAEPSPSTGVVAIAVRPAIDPTTLLAEAAAPVVVLEDPRHMGNVGAVVRVAAAAGAAGVLTTGAAHPWHPAALRGSAGLHFALPVARIDALPPLGGRLVGLDPAGAPLGADSLPDDTVLVFGTERGGLTKAVRSRCARLVALPMRVGVSSLNLATAAAAALYLGRRLPGR
jgi:TrmH family RNA methyltransferase